ncbi:conserved membrane hypothetical protein [Hyella patelloides LEGE 07179]|uniref:CHASE2 domain-containing protein n=1 Tax=Hyella patelloides LEGE 07179 TaxID=945734 RepID=A0A563VY91_9CYAN|nr:CHASE2 domain-containing protein [Hyella patelloides]VEP16422.1 conserved membrane hypothetical protein [Hyella patelloides LEGE 07179]
MAKLVVFKLDGDFAEGFRVDVEIFFEDKSFGGRKSGELPSALELLQYLETWQLEYRSLGNSTRIKGKKVIFTSSNARSKLNLWGEQLKKKFHRWLRAESFQDINLWLREKLDPQESIRMLLCTNNQKVHQLPWNQWDFVQSYPRVEIALSRLDVAKVSPFVVSPQKSQVRILAIFGSSHQINVEQDLKILTTLQNTYLEPLIEPQREVLYDRLWSECWDLVFFAGHSETIAGQGIIYLNEQDVLTITDLEYTLQTAIAKGLQLAIFNSCDGLGLAYALGQLALPQIIVMREPIIDAVAHKFLDYFLAEYSNGQPLHLATRKARERLQAWERKYPFSSWLPVLYQNQSATPPLWSELTGAKNTQRITKRRISDRHDGRNVLIVVSAIAFCLVWFAQAMGWLQAAELKNYDRALSLRPAEARDERILVITVDDRDIKYQSQQGMTMRGSLADEALAKLLTKIEPYAPVAIASDIIHDFAYSPQLSQITDKKSNFVAICRVANAESNLANIEPPPGITKTQTGFTNIAIDNDGVIRRHILGMSPDTKCQSDMSLSLRMALKYLDHLVTAKKENQTIYPRRFTENGYLEIGKIIFPKIEFDSGAYQLPKTENRSYQILFNYRALPPQTITLRQILAETSAQKLSNSIKEKIIFIGVKSHNNDLHYTLYSKGQQSARVPGVLIHAQATSQIISAVLDRRKLIRWLPNQLESLWMAIWGLIGSAVGGICSDLLFKKYNSLLVIVVAIFCSLTILYVSYFSLLLFGYWLPLVAPALAFILAASGSLFLTRSNKY